MEVQKEERYKLLGFKPQQENIYSKLLPYADKLDDESTKLFCDIKTNLVKSVLAREMRPGCAVWTARLHKYIRIYGLKFSKEDHISLIKLYYELATIPNLDPIRINKFCSILRDLLKKKLLSPEDLQLDWRPLYDMFIRVTVKSKSVIGMLRYYSSLDTVMETVIRFCRLYFPIEATQEILDEFRPKLSLTDVSAAMHYMGLFLPIIAKPENKHLGYELWLDELMKFWEVSHSSNGWENRLAWLVARLAYYNPGLINWEPYVSMMFVRFRRVLQLPVSYRKRQSIKFYSIDNSAIAMWIVFSLGGKTDTIFCHLEKLMQSLETYYHPANTGKWANKIRELLKQLAYYFVERIYLERYKKQNWEQSIPEEFKLSDQDIERFVNILKPSLEQAIFSRSGNQDVSSAMQYLSSLRPDIIIPMVLDKVYSSMDSLTEPHKLVSSMVSLMSVARYMVQDAKDKYPKGPTHIFPLLTSLLPGIDPNDSKKCMMTFNLISHFANLAPLVDSSEASQYYDDLTEEEHEICEASAYLQDFVLQFFDKIFTWVESNSLEFTRHEQSDNNRKNKLESLSENALFYVTTSVLHQSSPKIYTAALKKVHIFATNRILESKISGKLVAILCACFVKVNRKETMTLFFPGLFDTIENLLGENDDVILDEEINAELHYNLLILAEMLDGMSELLNYMDRITKILDRILHMTSIQGSRLASKMLNLIMNSLTFIQPTEYRSCNKPYPDDVKEYLTVREWGQPCKISKLNIQWFQPGKAEIECVQHLIYRYLVPELEVLEKYASGEIKLERRELCLRVRLIAAVLGCQSVLPQWQEPNIELINSVLDSWNFELLIGDTHVITLSDGRNVRKVIADTLHKVQKKVLEVDEGDTKTIHNIIHIYNILLFNKFRGRDFDMHWKRFHLVKKYLEDRLHQNKKHLRFILIDRAMLQQEIRHQYRTCSFTATHKQILLDLFELSTSHYSEVRIGAQNKLFNMMDTFPYSYRIIIPKIKEILKLDSTANHEKFKGCLYVLAGTKSAPIITRHDWNMIEELWPLLINSKPSEKLSIIRLMLILADAVKQFPTIQIKFSMPDSCMDAAYKLVDTVPAVTLVGFQEVVDNAPKLVEIQSESRSTAYTGTINLLLDACKSGNLHWRYYSMTVGFMRDMVHTDIKYSPQIVNFCLNSLIHESLEIRKIAIRIFTYILLQNKPEYKKLEIDPYSFGKADKNDKLKPGIRSDNEWLLYKSETAPLNAADWDKTRFVHKRNIGYYDWPKPLQVYSPSYEQPSFSKRLDNLSDQEKEILEFFNEENIETWIKYLSLEEKKGKDIYNGFRFLVFKYLFKIFEDHFLHLFVPHLERLTKDNQEQSQRCAAEIIGGIIRGSKHWSFDKIVNLWSILLPILRNTFSNMTNETLGDWCLCFSMALHGRDPNRHHWLLEFLMENPMNEPTSFITTCRLQILQLSINQQCWRNVELANRLLVYLNENLSHPFQNVRDKISSSLTVIFSEDIGLASGNAVRCPKVQAFFNIVRPQLNQLYESTIHIAKNIESEDGSLTSQMQLISLSDNDRDTSIRLFKTVCKYVTGSIARINYVAVPEHYELLPLACVLQSNDTDDELTLACTNLLAVMGHTLIFKDYVPEVLKVINKVSSCPFWSARAVIAEFIPVLVFHNFEIVVTQNEWVLEIQNIVLTLLEDIQPEVRAAAAKALSGFLHCNFLPNPSELLSEFKRKSRTKLRNRQVGSIYMNGVSNTNQSFCIRHAAVLGMCAFINSHPYDVPDYLSDIFVELGKHLNDPQPIPATIRNTLGDFKRTHHDNWEVHKLKFTEDELCLLSDLTVPPSYYA